MLLVVTNKSDLACDVLILRLKERRIPFFRLNTEDYGKVFQVNMSLIGGAASYEIEFSGGRLMTETDIGARPVQKHKRTQDWRAGTFRIRDV